MQEVFEKIIGKLDKLMRFYQMDAGSLISYEDVVGVIKAEAEEYNNGWIPCSERLPDEGRFYFVTVEMWNKAYGTEYCLFENGKWYLVADGASDENTTWKEEIKSVIAWQPLPPRYEPKED